MSVQLGTSEWRTELESFQAPFLEEKLLKEGTFATHEEYEVAFAEFKRYVMLGVLTQQPLSMLSPTVDSVWHQYILFTREYAQFCDRFVGHFLHHSPNTSFTPLAASGKENFLLAYKEYFGALPQIWSTRAACTGATCEDEQKATRSKENCQDCDFGNCATGDEAKTLSFRERVSTAPPAIKSQKADCGNCGDCGD